MKLKVAALQDSYSFPKDFSSYQKKITHLIHSHADRGVQLLVFPEYAGLEILSFTPIENVQDYLPSYLELFQTLSAKYKMLICSGTQVVKTEEGFFNRSYLFSPEKKPLYQDKCILTPEEVQEGILAPGKTLNLLDTPFGKIGICVCYDSEFPPLVKELTDAGAKIILVPSYTGTLHGFYRVFLSCRARALENQCYVIQSALVGQTDVEIAHGASAILGPVDEGFPEDGILAMGTLDSVESVLFTLDLPKLEFVRSHGKTHNFHDAKKLKKRTLNLLHLG